MKSINKCSFEIKNGSIKTYFNIYQARSGKLMLQIGKSVTPLTYDQISELCFNPYELIDFDYDDFKKAYEL